LEKYRLQTMDQPTFGPGTILPDSAQLNRIINALGNLPSSTQEAVWLGAMLTKALGSGDEEIEANCLIAALEAIRAATIDQPGGLADPKAVMPVQSSHALMKGVDAGELRAALNEERKLKISYYDKKGEKTSRIVWPLDVEDFGPQGAMLCWCETRQDFRHFRFDRVMSMQALSLRTPTPRSVLRAFATVMMRNDGGW
jgi:predicted DNA-binding transcriptional regulator YafY